MRVWGLVFACWFFDQLTKFLVFSHGRKVDLLPFLSIWPVHNEGFTFGLLRDWEGPLRDALYYGVPTLLVFLLALALVKAKGGAVRLALALVLGGALGNLTDRLLLGKVRDFLDLHWNGWHYPTFNAADVCISVGLLLLLLAELKRGKPKKV
ncbi:MAG: signal peptidase II [Aquificae bacterium]|nr:signal peptidase II [Aquificota bacterium]